MYKVTIEREDCEPVRIESEAIIVIGAKVIEYRYHKFWGCNIHQRRSREDSVYTDDSAFTEEIREICNTRHSLPD